MSELLTAAQMRAIEAAAIASGEVTGLELMERAGRGVVEAVFAEWPELAAGSFRAVVLCGPGNNGGDGFVVARLLKEWGWEVEVFLYGTPEGMPPDARVNYERWVGMGEVKPLNASMGARSAILVVDALFGLGLKRGLDPDLAQIIEEISYEREWPQRVCALDCPSGLCLDSGKVLGEGSHGAFALAAELTVTFAFKKVGHVAGRGPDCCGKVRVVDIGLRAPNEWTRFDLKSGLFTSNYRQRGVMSVELAHGKVHVLNKTAPLHKFSHGHAMILCGPPGHGGAARMTARGALRVGAGLVTLACPPDATQENAARLDAIMLFETANAEDFIWPLEDSRVRAFCIGPGMEDGMVSGEAIYGRVRAYMKAILASRKPVVLDAAALRAYGAPFCSAENSLEVLWSMLHSECVLTPHHGEFSQLFPDIAAKLEAPALKGPAYSKVDATREAAARAGCTVLFKGADTVIASPDGTCAINSAAYDRAAPWLATAGSGDVLAGFITGLLARGFGPQQAAETGAWLHVECARSFGPGLIAEDLPEELPKVFRALGV